MPSSLAVDSIQLMGKLANASFWLSNVDNDVTMCLNSGRLASSSRMVLYSSSVMKNIIAVLLQSKGMEFHCLAGFSSLMYCISVLLLW